MQDVQKLAKNAWTVFREIIDYRLEEVAELQEEDGDGDVCAQGKGAGALSQQVLKEAKANLQQLKRKSRAKWTRERGMALMSYCRVRGLPKKAVKPAGKNRVAKHAAEG